MKRTMAVGCAVALTLMLAGCLHFSIGTGGGSGPDYDDSGRYTALIRESRTLMSSDRKELLFKIAAKPDLTQSDREALVKESRMLMSSDRKRLLDILADNTGVPPRVVTAPPAGGGFRALIEESSTLNYTERKEMLFKIARNPNLTEDDREALIDASRGLNSTERKELLNLLAE